MRAFKGYVSPSREGILSDRPDAAEHDRPAGAAPAGGGLPEGDRLDEAARLAAERAGDEDGGSGAAPAADEAVRAMPSLPDAGAPRPASGRFRPTPRVIAAALAVNAVLVAFFAFIMHLDRPEPPREVYFIELADRPAADGGGPRESGAADQDKIVPNDTNLYQP